PLPSLLSEGLPSPLPSLGLPSLGLPSPLLSPLLSLFSDLGASPSLGLPSCGRLSPLGFSASGLPSPGLPSFAVALGLVSPFFASPPLSGLASGLRIFWASFLASF